MFIPRFRQVVIILAFLSNLLIAACNPITNPNAVSRNYKLYHQCSRNFVTITSKQIRATNWANNSLIEEYTHLQVQTVLKHVKFKGPNETLGTSLNSLSPNATTVKIVGKKVSRFVCFSKKGKMILRHVPHESCEFEEIVSDSMYTEFRSVFYPKLYIGFKCNGKSLKKYTYEEFNNAECFRFLKEHIGRSHNEGEHHSELTIRPPPSGHQANTVGRSSRPRKQNKQETVQQQQDKGAKKEARTTTHKHRHHRGRHKGRQMEPLQINGSIL